ncbi:MAG: nucleotidyltransferase domain-containing protein [Stigonema ocellatum SAG 48.90 = DSM 106950]|nr:nucleotidyltransferase domain-containing protein [Stigonema ocellatum SAG 48.90 = DSM 106950]
MNEKLQVILSQLRSRYEEIYGDRLVKMILFGSQARGDAKPDSDIDVLVVLKGEVNLGEEIEKTGNIVAALSLEFNEVISCLYMDEYRFTHRHGPLLRNIRKEGLVV